MISNLFFSNNLFLFCLHSTTYTSRKLLNYFRGVPYFSIYRIWIRMDEIMIPTISMYDTNVINHDPHQDLKLHR